MAKSIREATVEAANQVEKEERKKMSDMRSKVAFITVSDLHFSQEAPRARAEKGDEWLKVQWRYMEQLARLKDKHNCEVVYAGDIFNTWKEPAEIVNLVIQNLPRGYAIPGQHDLPYHRYEDMAKSPYWTLVRAGVLENLPPGQTISLGYKKPTLFGFPWGSSVGPRPEIDEASRRLYGLQVAVVHAYAWNDTFTGYEGAPFSANVSSWIPRLKGYDVAVFGDNHKGFIHETTTSPPTLRILNNGHFIRRTRDDKNFGAVGIVYEDGSVERVMLDCSKDRWEDVEVFRPDGEFTSEELEQLMRVLRKSTAAKVDFANILLRSLDDAIIGKLARDVIIKALEESR